MWRAWGFFFAHYQGKNISNYKQYKNIGVAESMMAIVDFQGIKVKNIEKDCKFGDDKLHRFDASEKFKKRN